MSTFPPFAACTACGERWPANVLDNHGICPICWATADAGHIGAQEAIADVLDPEWDEAAAPVEFIGPDDAPQCYCRRCLIHDDPAGCLVRFPS